MDSPLVRVWRLLYEKNLISSLRRIAALVLLVFCLPLPVVASASAGEVPGLPAAGQVGFSEYELAEPHRAFAIAPGGAWAWRSGLASAEAAARAALDACAEQTEQTCVPYSVDEAVVFDRAAWPALWRPYGDAARAAAAPVGTGRGQRFPDLAFTDTDGQPLSLSRLRGKVVVVHFWGSWCPPCLAELPEMARLYQAVAGNSDIRFVLLQAREPVANALALLKRKGYALPQYDSGADGRGPGAFTLADGASLADRIVAPLFPTTYVLDRHGLVLFAARGIAAGWPDYADFLRDAAGTTGPQ